MYLTITRVTSIEVNVFLHPQHDRPSRVSQQVDTVRRVVYFLLSLPSWLGNDPNRVTGVLSNQQVIK